MYVQSPFFFFFFVRWALPRFHTPPILGGLHHALAPHNHALARARIYPLTQSLPQLLPLFRSLNPSLPNPRSILLLVLFQESVDVEFGHDEHLEVVPDLQHEGGLVRKETEHECKKGDAVATGDRLARPARWGGGGRDGWVSSAALRRAGGRVYVRVVWSVARTHAQTDGSEEQHEKHASLERLGDGAVGLQRRARNGIVNLLGY